MFDKYMVKILEFKKQNCKDLIPIAQLNGVASLCRLFDSLGTTENGVCSGREFSVILKKLLSVCLFIKAEICIL